MAGEYAALDGLIRSVSTRVLSEMDAALREDTRDRYGGTYRFIDDGKGESVDSSVVLSADSEGPGLLLKGWVSNGTDFHSIYSKLKGAAFGEKTKEGEWQARLIPTGLWQGEDGEVWRLMATRLHGTDMSGTLWDAECSTDVDTLMYGGVSVEEFVFKVEGGRSPGAKVVGVSLSAFRIFLEHMEKVEGAEANVRLGGFEERMVEYGPRYQRPLSAHV